MITTITQFRLQEPISLDEAREIFLSTAPKYRDVAGLRRKCYLFADDGVTVGGVYLWDSRAHAEAMYTDSWRAFVTDKYGTEPEVTWFETPVVVDNLTNEIQSDD